MPERDSYQSDFEGANPNQETSEESGLVYSVYVNERIYHDIFRYCKQMAKQAPPREALGVILGFRRAWQGVNYIRVTDWATGRVEASMTHARFTPEGILEYRLMIHDRYGSNPHTPRVVGLWHSHPFGGDPQFSSTDLNTFLRTPFCAEGNIFFLIDPISEIFKVYMLHRQKEVEGLQLSQVDWCSYYPSVPLGKAPPLQGFDNSETGDDNNG